MMTDSRRRSRAHVDWPLLIATYALALVGLFFITVATFDPDKGTDLSLINYIANSRSSTWQATFLLFSPVALLAVMAIPMEIYRARVRLIYYAVLGLLAVTLISAQLVFGTKAWLEIGLSRSVQPAEFAKISIMMMLARMLSRSEKPMGTVKELFRVMLMVGIPAGIILLQGETGAVIVIGFMFIVMIYFGNVRLGIVLSLVAAVAAGIVLIIGYALLTESTDYRILRLLAFTAPEAYKQTGGYQILKSQMAIGAGGMTGVGAFVLGSVAQLGYVPESSTDFIFSVVGETLGFAGSVAILAIYLFMILRMLYLARFTNDRFGQLIIIGVMAMLLFHVFENIAMTLGLMPITGIPLPFLSYGGSNLLTNIIGIALVLNVTRSRSAAHPLNAPLPKTADSLYS